MSQLVATEFEQANRAYAATFDKGSLPLPPSRKVAILACMDARLDVARALGLEEGDAHVIRNAGGRAQDALRSIVISQQLLGTREVVVVHHTDCGMLTFDDAGLQRKLEVELGVRDTRQLQFYPFGDLEQSVREDVELIRSSPLTLEVPVTGYIYDVKTGTISRV